MLIWFAVLGLPRHLGDRTAPADPPGAQSGRTGSALLLDAPWRGFIMLGAVFLAVTGAETLYADMGHFGRAALRRAWLGLVFPALVLNYFGQGALLLGNPAALENPFYRLAPEWGLYPLVALATVATIIASQAVISGAFSITRQAVQLGYLPRLEIRHTSEQEIGQVYVPRINSALLVAIVILVIGFRLVGQSRRRLRDSGERHDGDHHGLGLFVYAQLSGWSLALALPVFAVFGIIDLTFLSANLLKIAEGGWFPIVVAAVVFTGMASWWRGRRMLAEMRGRDALPLRSFVEALNPEKPARIPGTAIFMTRDLERVPVALLHALKHYKVLHERVVMMLVETQDVPHVPDEQRLEITEQGKGFYTIRLRYGFTDEPNVLRALAQCRVGGFHFNLMETSFVIGREKLRLRPRRRRMQFGRWRDQLFILMSNNTLDATEFFRIPPNRVVELGGQIEI